MLRSRPHSLVLFIALAALLLLACETTNLIGQMTQKRPATRSSSNPTQDPSAILPPYEFVVLDQPRCSVGDNSASVITGNITRDGAPAFGQQVHVSASPGFEPVDAGPVQADESGNFQAVLICSSGSCFGSFLLWLVNDEGQQISPSIEYIFDGQCQRGTVNFGTP
ncbi:MAG: hypothetical protein IT331_23035 [Anaerolineae bacterium]|nr:hypothetical protein [Anaerolineae bacterium]